VVQADAGIEQVKKQPGFYLYTGDWKKDTALSLCSTSTRGIWIDLLCAMHDAGSVGRLSGTIEQLSVLARCSPTEMSTALSEITSTQAASVAHHNGIVTVINRRMDREAKARESARKRMKRSREKRHPPPSVPDVARVFTPSSLSSSIPPIVPPLGELKDGLRKGATNEQSEYQHITAESFRRRMFGGNVQRPIADPTGQPGGGGGGAGEHGPGSGDDPGGAGGPAE
jgi:uncharacterized protein YdaU (DUF1376 family)